MENNLNLKEKIHKRVIPILAMKGFNNEEKTIALESIYDTFEKQGYKTNIIGLLISECIVEEMKNSLADLNLAMEHFKSR